LDESFGLAVPARRVGRGTDVAELVLAEELFEGPTMHVDEGVVGHHRLGRREPELGEPGDRSLEGARVGVGVLSRMQLEVSEPRVVVDDDVEVVVADGCVLIAPETRAAAITGCGLTGPAEAQLSA
jgi:hypothetical protein